MMINLEYELMDNLWETLIPLTSEEECFEANFAALKNSEDFDEGSGGGCVA